MGKNYRNKKGKNAKSQGGKYGKDSVKDSARDNSNGRTNLHSRRVNKDVSPTNDPKWYTGNSAISQAAGNFTFWNPLGTSKDFGPGPQNDDSIIDFTKYRLPGVCALHYAPTIGKSDHYTSAVNLAATNLYSFIRHANSGHANYEAPDLMMYLLSVANVFSYYTYLCRLYGSLISFSAMNYYTPKVVIESMGVDYDDLKKHINDLRYYINTVAARISTLAVPNTMPIFSRMAFMQSGIYKDAPVANSGLYLWVSDYYYMYEETSDVEKYELGHLKPILFYGYNGGPDHKHTFDTLVEFGDKLVNALMSSEDIGIMSGDILKAYGSNLISVNPIAEDFSVSPSYDLNVLLQIHNAEFISAGNVCQLDESSMIYQDADGVILHYPLVGTTNQRVAIGLKYTPIHYGKALIDVPIDIPSSDDVFEFTRCKPTYDQVRQLGNFWIFDVDVCGTEIPLGMMCYYFNRDNEIAHTPMLGTQMNLNNYSASSGTFGILESLVYGSMLTKFGFCPNLFWFYCNDSGELLEGEFFTDFSNYTVIEKSELKRLHDAALLSLFNVPSPYGK